MLLWGESTTSRPVAPPKHSAARLRSEAYVDDPEREAVVHRRRVGQHQPLALVAVQRHRGTPVGEVEGQPLPELVPRPGRAQVEERLERQVDRLDLPRVVLAPGEQSADLAGQDTAASVVLDGELPLAYAEQGRGLRVHHLLDSLDLHEVVARADRAEPEPRKLHRESGELVPQAVHAAVPPEVEPAALLDTLEVVGGGAPALHAELGAVLGRLEHLAGAQLLVRRVFRSTAKASFNSSNDSDASSTGIAMHDSGSRNRCSMRCVLIRILNDVSRFAEAFFDIAAFELRFAEQVRAALRMDQRRTGLKCRLRTSSPVRALRIQCRSTRPLCERAAGCRRQRWR